MPPLLGCIADDFTGATDLAGTLVAGGMRTLQTIGVPDFALPDDLDAVVVALKSRTIPPEDAVAQSLAALEAMRRSGVEKFFFKYCSTFDSTDRGNIGPVTEALMRALRAPFSIACPAFPTNGRTVYMGHLFVGDRLLSESGMRHHPLTPMTDPDLVRVLGRQTQGRVGSLPRSVVAAGAEAVVKRCADLRVDGITIAVADAIDDDDLRVLGAASADLPLIGGGSGLAIGLPAVFRATGRLAPVRSGELLPTTAGGAVVLSGSCSVATRGQVAAWRETRPALRIDPLELAAGPDAVDAAIAFASSHDRPVLVYSSADPEEVKAAQAALGTEAAGRLVEDAFGRIAVALRDRGTGVFVVAGGEVSGAVVAALGVEALRIGAPIDPGVPWTVSSGAGRPLALALKSGNFGARDFFEKALRLRGVTP